MSGQLDILDVGRGVGVLCAHQVRVAVAVEVGHALDNLEPELFVKTVCVLVSDINVQKKAACVGVVREHVLQELGADSATAVVYVDGKRNDVERQEVIVVDPANGDFTNECVGELGHVAGQEEAVADIGVEVLVVGETEVGGVHGLERSERFRCDLDDFETVHRSNEASNFRLQ